MLSQEEKDNFEKELYEINERLKGDFVNPKDMRRKDAIQSLMMTDGASANAEFIVKRRGNGIGKGTHNLRCGIKRNL